MKHSLSGRTRIAALLVLTAVTALTAFALTRHHSTPQNLGLETAEGEEAGADGPGDAFQWRRLRKLDENGKIAAGAWSRAMKQRAALAQGKQSGGIGILSGGGTTFNWQFRGPNNITGRTRCLIIHPTQPNRMWAGGVGGGIWYSSDSGVTFNPVNDQMSNLAIGCMAMDPTNANIMYAGTGEGYGNGDSIAGAGMFKSTDGGVTWNLLANTAGFQTVNRISVSPTNHNIVLATVDSNWAVGGGGGIYRSLDGGATWANVLASTYGAAYTVAFNPSDGTKAIATSYDYDFGLGNYVHKTYYSTTSGASFLQAGGPISAVANFQSRIELAYAPSSPNIVYGQSAADGKIYKSTDGGANYALVTVGNTVDLSTQGWYDNAIWVSPTDPNFLVMCGVSIFKSTDGGVTITKIGGGYNVTGPQAHPDAHFITSEAGFDGVTNKTIYVTTDGGPYKADVTTASISGGWTGLGNQATTQFYGAAGDGVTGRIIGGLQDNGTPTFYANDLSAHPFAGSDGGFAAMDPTDSNFMYGETQWMYIFRTTNGGASGTYIYSGISDVGGNSNFIAPFILDPNNPNTMLAGGYSLWRSTNVKATTPTFTSIRPGGSQYISAVAVAPGNSNIIWVAQNDGKIYKTANGTAASPTWSTVDDDGATNPLPDRYPGRILIDPANSNVVYVALGGFTASNLWKTTNGGTTWTDITGVAGSKLPFAPIYGIARHPMNANFLVAATDVGIFASFDGGSHWTTSNTGPNAVSADEVTFMNNSQTLLIATHGRGLWTADIPIVTSVALSPTSAQGGNTVTGTVTISEPAPVGGTIVSLSSNNAAATVGSSVTVPANATSVNFNVTTSVVGSDTPFTITATLNGLPATANGTVIAGAPPTLSTLTLSKASVVSASSDSVSGTVTLSGPAAADTPVSLSSSVTTAATVPATVTVLAGNSTANFAITPVAVTSTKSTVITATLNAVSKTATLTVLPIAPASIKLTPPSQTGGLNIVAVVAMNAAPTADAVVTVTNSNTAATAPGTVTVLAGNLSASFTITTVPVTAITSGTLTVKKNGISKATTLKVLPPTVKTVTFSPTSVVGSKNSTGTVTLTGVTLVDLTVTLSSANTAVAQVPASVTVLAGHSTATFITTTSPVAVSTAVNISGTYGTTAKVGKLTVKPPTFSTFTLTPSTVVGGNNVTGKVTMSGPVVSNTTVNLTNSNTKATLPGPTVTILAGQASVSFIITTQATTVSVSGFVTAQVGATTKSVALKVTP